MSEIVIRFRGDITETDGHNFIREFAEWFNRELELTGDKPREGIVVEGLFAEQIWTTQEDQ